MVAYENEKFLSTTLTEPDFDINIPSPIPMVQGEPHLTNMVATTPKADICSWQSNTVTLKWGIK